MGAVILLLVFGGLLTAGMGLPEIDVEVAKGGDGSDGLTGSDGDDTLAGGGGNDLLLGKDGNDTLSGDGGSDWLIGSDGDDDLIGGAGDDVLIGGAGHDQIDAGEGDDFVEAANVVDEQRLESSAATATGLSDIDFVYGLPGTSDQGDVVDLGPGDDTVVGGDSDTLTGGAGADEFALGDWIKAGNPAEITDFDSAEDLLSIAFAEGDPLPEMEVRTDTLTGAKTVYADGKPIAVLSGASPEFSLRNVAITRYAA